MLVNMYSVERQMISSVRSLSGRPSKQSVFADLRRRFDSVAPRMEDEQIDFVDWLVVMIAGGPSVETNE